MTLLNEVYYKGTNFSAIANENARHLEVYFMYNWLIGSKERTKEDDTSNQFWKSRNIPPQETVFVCAPENTHFKNWHDFQEDKIVSSIDVPLYLIQKAQNKHIVDLMEVSIGIELKECIYVIREGFYDESMGFTLSVNNDSNII